MFIVIISCWFKSDLFAVATLLGFLKCLYKQKAEEDIKISPAIAPRTMPNTFCVNVSRSVVVSAKYTVVCDAIDVFSLVEEL